MIESITFVIANTKGAKNMEFEIITQLGKPIFVRFSAKFYDILRQLTITTMHHFVKSKNWNYDCVGRTTIYNDFEGYSYKFSNSEKESFKLSFYPNHNLKKIIMILNNKETIYSVEEMENPEFHDKLRSQIDECLRQIGVYYILKERKKPAWPF